MDIKGEPYISVNIMAHREKENKGNTGDLTYNGLLKKNFLFAFENLLKEKEINISKAKIVLYE